MFFLFWLSPIVAAFWMTKLVLDKKREMRAEVRAKEKTIQQERNNQQEAVATTDKVKSYYHRSFEDLQKIKDDVSRTKQSIEYARTEYSNNAYAPFWDMIVKSLANLSKCEESMKKLKYTASWYEEALAERVHDFPKFPITRGMLPDITEVAQDLYGTIRKGQTNINFALIYEQRVTREVLIRGFKTLGDAIGGAEVTINQSLRDLRSCLSKD